MGVQTSHPFWLPVPVGLTGAAGERKTNPTAAALEDLRVVGGRTNLVTSKGQISDYTKGARAGRSGPLQMEADIPLLAMFGKRDSARPLVPYPPQFTLKRDARLRTEVLNVGGESRGYLVFDCVPVAGDGGDYDPAYLAGLNNFYFTLDMGFGAVAEERKSDQSTSYNFDLLILGAFTDTAAASIGVQIFDHMGRPWQPLDTYVPVWAVAGRGAGQMPINRWVTPYLLPAGHTINCLFQNAVAADGPENNGSITFECLQLNRVG